MEGLFKALDWHAQMEREESAMNQLNWRLSDKCKSLADPDSVDLCWHDSLQEMRARACASEQAMRVICNL